MRITKGHPKRARWIQSFLFLSFVFILSAVRAEDKTPEKSDKLDLQKLEDKYWSAKDSDFAVVQNRTYPKDKRFFASGSYGLLFNDSYSNGKMYNIAAGYYFSERWGLEFAQEVGSLTDNASTSFIANQNGLKPNQNKFANYTSVNAIFVPFYAKMSFVDRAILYFDIQIALGVGTLNYDSIIAEAQGPTRRSSTLGYNFDFTQQLFFSRHLAFRLDIKNKWSKQNLYRYQLNSNETEAARSLGSNSQQDTTVLFGLTFFF